MKISQILSSKATGGVLTINSTRTIRDAIFELSHHKIGALVVSNDGIKAEGIISERDIIHELSGCGVECFLKSVGDLMTKKLVSCKLEDTAEYAMHCMTNGRFRHLPVLEDEKLIGLISIGDVVKARLGEMEYENSAMINMISGY